MIGVFYIHARSDDYYKCLNIHDIDYCRHYDLQQHIYDYSAPAGEVHNSIDLHTSLTALRL